MVFKKGMTPWNRGKKIKTLCGDGNPMNRPEVRARQLASVNTPEVRKRRGAQRHTLDTKRKISEATRGSHPVYTR